MSLTQADTGTGWEARFQAAMDLATGDTDPPFVSAAMRTQATVEAKLLNRVSPGPDYFARESLAWIKAHPSDPRDEELAGFGFRALHDTCRYIESETPAEKDLSRQLFQLLHARYPQSEWAKHYASFDMGDDN